MSELEKLKKEVEQQKEIIRQLPEMPLRKGLKLARDIHQEYLNMKRCPRNAGRKKWHRAWVGFYDKALS